MAKLTSREAVLVYIAKYGQLSEHDGNMTPARERAAEKLVEEGVLSIDYLYGDKYYDFTEVWDNTFTA